MTDLKELRRIALDATPGQWKYDWGNREIEAEKGRRGICAFHGLTEFLDDMTEREIYSFEQDDNANHIATFSPDTALALLDELERCRVGWSMARTALRATLLAAATRREALELIANHGGALGDVQAIARNALGKDK